jgi:Mn2+/Fe2+ NRAMP family transporter
MVIEEPAEQPGEQALPTESSAKPLGWRSYLTALGPGLISGASDNDPTTVGTLAVVGATTTYGLSWLTLLIYPMLASVQIISAQVGVVAKQGLQGVVRTTYGRRWGLLLLSSVLAVNLITIGADLEAGAAALGLLFHLAWQWLVIPYGLAMLGLLLVGSYRAVERILRFVLLVFIAYIISAFLAHPNWSAVLQATVLPPISLDSAYVQGALSLLGTTLTSYAYVWESIEEAEEQTPLRALGLARADAGVGMFFAVAIFWFILISTGATLGVHHQPVQTAQQAAQALAPVAGPLAAYLFAIGLLASAILAVPVLAATTGYILGEEFGWSRGLSQPLRVCRRFYLTVSGAILVGMVVSFLGISPITLLFWSGIVGGLGTPISLVFLLLVARDHHVMDGHPIGKWLTLLGWGTTILIGVISLYFLYQQFGS